MEESKYFLFEFSVTKSKLLRFERIKSKKIFRYFQSIDK